MAGHRAPRKGHRHLRGVLVSKCNEQRLVRARIQDKIKFSMGRRKHKERTARNVGFIAAMCVPASLLAVTIDVSAASLKTFSTIVCKMSPVCDAARSHSGISQSITTALVVVIGNRPTFGFGASSCASFLKGRACIRLTVIFSSTRMIDHLISINALRSIDS